MAPPLTETADKPRGGVVAPLIPTSPRWTSPSRRRRPWLWLALVSLLLIAQTALVWLTFNFEINRLQEEVETASASIAADIRQAISRDLQSLQALGWRDDVRPAQWRTEVIQQLLERRELLRIERRDLQMQIVSAVDGPYHPPIFSRLPRNAIDQETEVACIAAARVGGPTFSRSFFVPLPGDLGVEVVDVCIPVQRSGQITSFVVASVSLQSLLAEVVSPTLLQDNELTFIDVDGTRLARAGRPRGGGIYIAERLVDLAGQTMRLRVDSISGRPQLIPNLAVALVLGLSLALGAVVVLLARDMRRRSTAEHALAEALAFRKAMEDSLLTGLRARDLDGRVSYVNPAFCEMVGFGADQIIGHDPPPYWPPEMVPEYRRRMQLRQLPMADPPTPSGVAVRGTSREGFETTFMRKDGERFAVLIFEAPLVDSHGKQTGWMSAALDVSDQRRIEELSRQQQERLQATARLATVGEMASLLSHELNQPLAAISSYAAGSLNLLSDENASADDAAMLRQALERIGEQAERAGKVIKSVHDFVRRREQQREPVRVEVLMEAVLPLMRLQARKSGARIEVALADALPRVVCDRTMVEQVLLNLTRNGIQAMEEATTRDAARTADPGAQQPSQLGHHQRDRPRAGNRRRCGAATVHTVFHNSPRRHGAGVEPVPHSDRATRWRARFRAAGGAPSAATTRPALPPNSASRCRLSGQRRSPDHRIRHKRHNRAENRASCGFSLRYATLLPDEPAASTRHRFADAGHSRLRPANGLSGRRRTGGARCTGLVAAVASLVERRFRQRRAVREDDRRTPARSRPARRRARLADLPELLAARRANARHQWPGAVRAAGRTWLAGRAAGDLSDRPWRRADRGRRRQARRLRFRRETVCRQCLGRSRRAGLAGQPARHCNRARAGACLPPGWPICPSANAK